jgi:hypothetical protein
VVILVQVILFLVVLTPQAYKSEIVLGGLTINTVNLLEKAQDVMAMPTHGKTALNLMVLPRGLVPL